MADWWQTMRQQFRELEQREQRLVLLAAVLIAGLLMFFVIYKPIAAELKSVRQSHQAQLSLRDWMQVQVNELKQNKGAGSATDSRGNRSVSVLINQTAAQNQIQISRSQPRGNNQHQIWLDQVSFNQLMVWLTALQSDFGIFVHSINISKADSAGLVRVNLTFQDGA